MGIGNQRVEAGAQVAPLLQQACKAGLAAFDVRGIDISPDIKDAVGPDLVDRVEVGDFSAAQGSAELVCCVEVAEHIRPERSLDLVGTLTRLATRWIYFSAAPPGQLGRGPGSSCHRD